MEKVLYVTLLLFVAFATCHYSLSRIWRNESGCSIVAAVFAILVAVFLGGLLA